MASKKKPTIAVIGPVLPFRGGIAQYTTELHTALSKDAKVHTVSFKRMYPGWLYPGETDKEANVADIKGVQYVIDVYNPLTWRRAADLVADAGCEVAILDWWTLFWQPGFTYIVRRLRKRGVKTVFLCHNLVNHKTGGAMGMVDKVMYPTILWMLKQADAYLLQSSEQVAFMRELKPHAKILQKIHPIYDRFPAAKKKQAPRGKLDLLFFGFIRPYKGLPILMEALKRLDNKDIHLTIVGEPWRDKDELRAELEAMGVKNLELNLSYTSDDEAAEYFERADAVVLPYLSATGSGVVATAYHYKKPVIATSVGGLKDAVIEGSTGWLVKPNDAKELAKTIGSISRSDCQAMQPGIATFCRDNSWDAMAKAIMQTFTEKGK